MTNFALHKKKKLITGEMNVFLRKRKRFFSWKKICFPQDSDHWMWEEQNESLCLWDNNRVHKMDRYCKKWDSVRESANNRGNWGKGERTLKKGERRKREKRVG